MKKVLNFLNKYKYMIIPGILGIFVFIFLFGVNVLDPTNVEWLANDPGDLSQHYIGWEFYRRSPWTIDFGMNYLINYPFKISVIFTDSIPLFAFIFKIFSNILPEYFNYFGMYGLLCYILQGVSVGLILKKFIKEDYLICILSIIFLFSPIMRMRMFYHTSLSSHYLIFFALALAIYKDKLSTKKYIILWGILGFFTSLIHIYFLLMEGIILIGTTLYEFLTKKNIKKMLIPYITFIGGGTLSTFLFGGFDMIGEALNEYSFGCWNANLMSLFVSTQYHSKLYNLNLTQGIQYEGYGYIGIGGILLLIIALILFIINRKKFKNRIIISGAFTALFAYFFAIIGEVWILNIKLGEINLIEPLNKMLGMFMSNGRLIWITNYIVILLSIYIIYKCLNKKWSIILLSLAIIIQIGELNFNSMKYNIDTFDIDKNYDILDQIFDDGYKRLVTTNNVGIYINDKTLNFIALKHDIAVNNFPITQDLNHINPKFEKNIIDELGNPSYDTIYILSPNDYLKYENSILNYYTLDSLIIASLKEIPFLEKLNSQELTMTAILYNYIHLKSEEIYELSLIAETELEEKVLQELNDSLEFIGTFKEKQDYVYIYYVKNNNEIFISNNDSKIKQIKIKKY